MQYLPDKTDILAAVTNLLARQVEPTTHDPALRFRVRIAAHLLEVLRRELELEGEHTAGEERRLRALLGEDAELRELRQALCRRIPFADAAELAEIRAALLAGLAEHLAVSQPRFDTRLRIEDPEP